MERRKPSGRKRTIIMAAVACVVLVAAASVFIRGISQKYVYVTELERPQAGGEREYGIDVLYDGEVESIDVSIRERALDSAELEKLYQAAEEELETVVLGENESFQSVAQPLELVDKLDKYNMSVRWYIEDGDIIDYMGQIYRTRSEQRTYITAELQYRGRVMREDEGREYVYEVKVLPYSDMQLRRLELENLVAEADEKSAGSSSVPLPDEYRGKSVLYRVQRDNSYLLLTLLVPIVALLIPAKKRSDAQSKRKKTEELMAGEYPEIISKLSLLIGAGMTPYNALSRIAADGKGEAYRRLSGVVRRIQSGASEREQYSQFGRIFGVYCYSKLGTLLEQNVVRGNEQLRVMLNSECIEALEERKARARKKGEQAGTKMLFPMLLMLLVVMAIIMVPAFMSF